MYRMEAEKKSVDASARNWTLFVFILAFATVALSLVRTLQLERLIVNLEEQCVGYETRLAALEMRVSHAEQLSPSDESSPPLTKQFWVRFARRTSRAISPSADCGCESPACLVACPVHNHERPCPSPQTSDLERRDLRD